MQIKMMVECDVRFVQGKFAGRDEIVEALQQEIEGANPGSIDANEGEYEVEDFVVSEWDEPKSAKRPVYRTPFLHYTVAEIQKFAAGLVAGALDAQAMDEYLSQRDGTKAGSPKELREALAQVVDVMARWHGLGTAAEFVTAHEKDQMERADAKFYGHP